MNGGYRHLAIGVFAVSLAALLWVAVDAVERFYPRSVPVSEDPAVGRAGERAAPQYSVDKIVAAHLFGEEKEAVEEVVEQAPETRLQMQLLGVIASSDGRLARAMIAVDRGNVGVYSVADDINNTDAKVRAVEAQRVLLDRAGTVESLSLQRKALETGLEEQSSTALPAQTGQGEPTPGSLPEPGDGGTEESNEIRYRGAGESNGGDKPPF